MLKEFIIITARKLLIIFINSPLFLSLMFPKPSLSTLLLTANLVTLSCDPVLVDFDSLCYTPFIDTLDATPAEAYASDTTTMTASIYTPCVSSTYLFTVSFVTTPTVL